jgi:hypothetical protein
VCLLTLSLHLVNVVLFYCHCVIVRVSGVDVFLGIYIC